jgi:pimeloyl-ACP methyl ester carboxylesterase
MVVVLLLFSLQSLALAWVTTPPTPWLISGAGGVGSVYVGAVPPNVDYNKPVLLFVHGKGSAASTWWTATSYHGNNDMYAYAYNNGYRTAFVNLYGDKNMWTNGPLLNTQIDTVRNYYGVAKVSIIAHSKGGIDANAASAYNGAASKISRIITLDSPHWGSPLADMAYSTWTWWLAEIFGARDEATYSLQTGYMSNFRAKTDGLDPAVPYWTTAGNKCGPAFSALWYGCMAISGQDDGAVPVWAARKPGGVELVNGYWDHDEVKMGSRTWSYFSPKIQTAANSSNLAVAWEGPPIAAAGTTLNTSVAKGPSAPGNLILRGGPTGKVQSFPVESKVRGATFLFYSSSPDFTATLTSPNGQHFAVTTKNRVDADQDFGGAFVASADVTAPAAGAWTITSAAAQPAAYLMVASLDSDVKATLSMGQQIATPGATQTLNVGFGTGSRTLKESKAEASLSSRGKQPHGRPTFTSGPNQTLTATAQLPAGNAIHNVTVTVTGLTDDGTAFERTLVSSFAAVNLEDRGDWNGE